MDNLKYNPKGKKVHRKSYQKRCKVQAHFMFMKLPCNRCLEKMGKKAAEMIGYRQRCCSETLEEAGELC